MERLGFYSMKDVFPTGLFKQPTWAERDNRFFLKDLGVSYAEWRALFHAYFAWLESKQAEGWTQAAIMGLTKFTAGHNQCFWNEVDNPAIPYSRASIQWPSGNWYNNSELWGGNGTYFYPGNDFNYGNGGFAINIDKATYRRTRIKPHEYHGLISWNYLLTNPSSGGTSGDWCHGLVVRGNFIGFGGDNPDPNIFSCGVVAQAPGERSDFEINGYGFNDHGLCIVGPGVPIRVSKSSFFYNGNAGLGLIGTGLANITLDNISGDCNSALVRAYTAGGYGVAGGRFTVINPKVEIFGTAGREGKRGKGEPMAELEGDFSWTQQGGTYSPQNNCYIDTMIRANPTHNVCNISIEGMEHFLCRHWLHDMKTGEKFAVDNDFFQTGDNSFKWRSDLGGKMISAWTGEKTAAVTGSSPKRLKWLDGDPVTGVPQGSFDHVNGTPAYPADLWALYLRDPITGTGITPPPPPPPGATVIDSFTSSPASLNAPGQVTLAWQTTNATSVSIDQGVGAQPVDGVWSVSLTATTTFTLTAIGPGGTTTRPVTVNVGAAPPPPPPPAGVKWFGGPYAKIETAPCVTLSPAITATQVRLTAFKTSSLGYGRIVGTGAAKESLVVWPDGGFRWGSPGTGWTICATSPSTKVALNTAWSGTITLPAAKAIICPWHTDCGSGGTPLGSCTKLELL